MSVPGIVQSTLDGEEIAARVSLGGEDELFITPSKTIIYRAEGLLSDESVDEFPHDANRLTLSEGRRKTRFSLEYALDGKREFTIPAKKTEAVLRPVLAGVLNGNGITDPGESVLQTYRFSELTLIITSDRLVKHIGEPVWDEDFEGYHFDDVTELSFEDGSVATQIVMVVDGRPQRIKAPNDAADDVTERLQRALFSYYDVASLGELNDVIGEEPDDEPREEPTVAFGEGVDPLDANPPEPEESDAERGAEAGAGGAADPLAEHAETDDPLEAPVDAVSATETDDRDVGANAAEAVVGEAGAEPSGAADAFEGSGFQPATAGADPEVLDRLEALEATVDRQNELLERHQRTIERLIEELRQGR